MSKKLQVFISSTFTDLRDERQAAVEATLLAKHIPAGMELFSAGDASQWQVIQEWISTSDVYLLILGARYGSIEPTSGLSYTELEYNFATQRGMPYFAVVLDEAAVQTKREVGFVSGEDTVHTEKLSAFRAKVLSKSSRIVKDSSGIQLAILQSLHEIEQRPSLVGWVRPGPAVDMAPLLVQLTELSALKEQNSQLRARVAELEHATKGPDLSVLDATLQLTAQTRYKGYSQWDNEPVDTTWRQLFSEMAMKLLATQNDGVFNEKIARVLVGASAASSADARIIDSDWEKIRATLLRLGLVDIRYSKTITNSMALFWSLTPLGKQVGIALKSA